MLLTSFTLRPHDRSPRYIRLYVFDSLQAMRLAMEHAGADSSDAMAAFVGCSSCPAQFGEVYLYLHPDGTTDAVHELVHAAAYYALHVRRRPITPQTEQQTEVSEGEEILAETVEQFCEAFAARERRIRNKLTKISGLLDRPDTISTQNS